MNGLSDEEAGELGRRSRREKARPKRRKVLVSVATVIAACAAVWGVAWPEIQSWAQDSSSLAASFTAPSDGETIMGRQLDVTIDTKNYADSADTLWVVVRPPNQKTWYPQQSLEHRDGRVTNVRVTLGSSYDPGDYQIFVYAVPPGDNTFSNYLKEDPTWSTGLEKFPQEAKKLDAVTVHRGS